MTPRQFLIIGGIVLLALGIVGYAGVFGPDSPLWLTTGENVAHTFLGIVALAAVYVPGLNRALEPYYRPIVALVAAMALFFTVYGLAVASAPPLNTFGVAQLNNPLDNLIHLAVGIWGGYVVFRKQPAEAMTS